MSGVTVAKDREATGSSFGTQTNRLQATLRTSTQRA